MACRRSAVRSRLAPPITSSLRYVVGSGEARFCADAAIGYSVPDFSQVIRIPSAGIGRVRVTKAHSMAAGLGRAVRLVGLLLALLLVARPAAATDADLAAWSAAADRAEAVIASAGASVPALQSLRGELLDDRDAADAIVAAGNPKARVLRAEIDALGPAPTDGSELPSIAADRTALLAALAAHDGPIVEARRLSARLSVLIDEVDSLVHRKAAAKLLSRVPSPLLPSSWLIAAAETTDLVAGIAKDMAAAWNNPLEGRLLAGKLALAGLWLAVSLALLPLRSLLLRRFGWRGGQLAPGASYAGIAIAYVGATALTLLAFFAAWRGLDSVPRGARLFDRDLALMVALLILGSSVSFILFRLGAAERGAFGFGPARAHLAHRLSVAQCLVLMLELATESVEAGLSPSPGTVAVFASIVITAGSVLLWALGGLLADPTGEDRHRPPRGSLQRVGATALRALAVIGVLLAVSGYVELARQAMLPTLLSLGLIGLALVLFRALAGFAAWCLIGFGVRAGRFRLALSLIIAGALALLLLPALGIAWGMSLADLGDVWRLLSGGVTLGNVVISPADIAVLVLLLAGGLVLTRWLQRLLDHDILPKTRLDASGRNAVVTGVGYVGTVLAALVAIAGAGIDLSNLALLASALTVGIGFGLQAVASNFVSGLLLLIERPIREGDRVAVAGYTGLVRKISVRTTRIETVDGHMVLVPNSELIAGTVTNLTLGSRSGRITIPVGVAYGSDVERVRATLVDVARRHPSVDADPPPLALFVDFGDSCLNFELRAFVADVDLAAIVRSDLLTAIDSAFRAAAIDIPFPQRHVTLIHPEAAVATPPA